MEKTMSSIVYGTGPGRVRVRIQGYLRGSEESLICGQMTDPGDTEVGMPYQDELLIIGTKDDFTIMPDRSTAFIHHQNIISIAYKKSDGGLI